ncbi:MAG: oxidoreductase [Chitinophagaceae bacterium]|nr:oxidoreductase [Chitinophagaceae bacterium]
MKFKIKIILLFVFIINGIHSTTAQTVKLLAEGPKASLRGLSVVNDRIIWVSGSNGTVGRSLDSGNTWKWMTVKGFEKNDFRDIEAFDETTAVIMGIGDPAYILRTADGGETWKVVFEKKTKGMFLDAMEFWNEMSGIVVGDPINNQIYIARSFDGGMNWKEIPATNYPVADSGEALFASSGTNIKKINQQEAVFVTGGLKSRLFIRDKKIDLPIVQGKETTGANSIAIKDGKIMVIVGGDFNNKDVIEKNCIITTDAGKSFKAPITAPHGYRSCVEYIDKKNWISCGLNGVDISKDDGANWWWISKESFHVCCKAKKGRSVFLAGAGGRIGKLITE